MEKKITTYSHEETATFAASFENLIKGGGVILLEGDLGAGKTTFSQALLKALDVPGPYVSPTFGVIQQYDREDGLSPIFHIDAYRINDQDMVELGWFEMVDDRDNIMIIEWPEKVPSLIKKLMVTDRKVVRVQIAHIAVSEREIIVSQ